ncbi:hypothetical protein ACFVRU_29865 [Streptomyces sp. NPDC057927]
MTTLTAKGLARPDRALVPSDHACIVGIRNHAPRMDERTSPTFDPVRATARQAGSIVELLDAMWERDRNDAVSRTHQPPSD